MENCDEEFEKLLQLIFPRESYPVIYDTLFNFKWKPNKYHCETFRFHNVKTGEKMDLLCKNDNLLQFKWKDITLAQIVGFLHDCGKPFVEFINRKLQMFTGHAQVGARLVWMRFHEEVPLKELYNAVLIIDSHMCCLRNNKINIEEMLRVNAVWHMQYPSYIIPMLKNLQEADNVSRILPKDIIIEKNMNYLEKPPFAFHKDKKIAIFIIGPSGSGKSTIAHYLKDELSEFNLQHLERDQVLKSLALENETYEQCYHRIYENPSLKRQFQNLWK
ncbi:uncharacterized protein CDAR_66771 [Caerostris darwini]|uniref:Uncharacterized protein n=1 Tax=Caerostris darwini TaxID=1538125 RepID=A0AAV4T7E8_9ARAC|nr:uncharacterized protein CDAR_66771 [Caerostris darwini]